MELFFYSHGQTAFNNSTNLEIFYSQAKAAQMQKYQILKQHLVFNLNVILSISYLFFTLHPSEIGKGSGAHQNTASCHKNKTCRHHTAKNTA